METVEESNKLIAEFMGGGWTGKIQPFYDERWVECPPMGIEYIKDLKYHSSWDWLMPVVEKIEETYDVDVHCLQPQFEDDTKYQIQIYISGTNVSGNNKIECYHKAVIEFIQWHIEQNQTA
jgi:hypothetical protein